MKNILLLFSLFVFHFTAISQTIDNEKSIVNFKIGNMGGMNNVKGTFTGFSGNVKFDPTQLENSKIDVCIDAASINTGNKKRDDHLRSEDFFEVEKHSKICFTSEQIIKHPQGFVAKGKLKMHGVTLTVEIPLVFENNKLTGLLTVNRFDYKVGEDTGTFMVGADVEIVIQCVLKP